MMKLIQVLSVILIPLSVFSITYDVQHYASDEYKSIILADMNGDECPEVLAGNWSTNHIEIWQYDEKKDSLVLIDEITGIGANIFDIAVGDLDHDGDPDVVAGLRWNGTVICTNGDEGWSVSSLQNTYCWQVMIADFNGDSHPDIFNGTDWDYIRIFYGDGSGEFTEGPAPVSEATNGHAKGFSVLDVNGDGRLDLMGMSSEWNGSATNKSFLRVYVNNENGDNVDWSASLVPDKIYADHPLWMDSRPYTATDLDENGCMDQLVFHSDGAVCVLWGSEEEDSLVYVSDTLLSDEYSTTTSTYVYDLNNDGKEDLLACGGDQYEDIYVFWNEGGGVFTEEIIQLGHGVGNFHGLTVGDINSDGEAEIIASRFDEGFEGFDVIFKEKNQQPSQLESFNIQAYASGITYKSIELADMNNDGRREVLAGNWSSNHIEIWQYDEKKDSLVLIDEITGIGANIFDIAVDDLDHDGDPDVVAGLRWNGTVICTNGDEGWSVSSLQNTYCWQVMIADFDGDSNPDIFNGTDWDYIRIFYGDGSGGFTEGPAPVSEAINGHAKGFSAIDVNGDGRVDLIGVASEWNASQTNQSFLRVYLNEDDAGSIAWSSSVGPAESFAGYPCWMESQPGTAGDFDADGCIDQITYHSDSTICIFWGGKENDSLYWKPDTMGQMIEITSSGTCVGDLNSDGNMDFIATGGEYYNGIQAFLGDGARSGTGEIIDIGHGVGNFHALAIGDINGNGEKDIIAARFEEGEDGFEVLYQGISTTIPQKEERLMPANIKLAQNYPNPFNGGTVIQYTLPETKQVRLVIHNTLGQTIRTLINSVQKAQSYQVYWDGKDSNGNAVSSGVYIYRLMTDDTSVSRKMIYIR